MSAIFVLFSSRLICYLHIQPHQLGKGVIHRLAGASMMVTTMADTAGMMYSIYVTSVIRYDIFVALASKNARTSPVAGSSSTIVRRASYQLEVL